MTYIIFLQVRMGVVNAVIQYADNNSSTCEAFFPDWQNIYVISDCSTSLTTIYLQLINYLIFIIDHLQLYLHLKSV